MRLFIQLSNGQPVKWPLSWRDVLHMAPPNVGFPDNEAAYQEVDLAEFGFETFDEATQPAFNPLTHKLVDAAPVKVDGAWTRQWRVEALDAATAAAALDQAKATKWEAIKAHRDHLSDQGGYQVDGKWFHSDGKSKTQQLSLFITGANVPAVQWKTMDGTFVTMTQALAAGIFQAAAQQDMAIFQAAEVHRAQMEASDDPAGYDFSAGWPATFGA